MTVSTGPGGPAAETGERRSTPGDVRRASAVVQCPRRQQAATVAAFARRLPAGWLSCILWCSLRGSDQYCSEDCRDQLHAALDPVPAREAERDNTEAP